VLRQNELLEIIRDFRVAEDTHKHLPVARILPSFNGVFTFMFKDETISQSSTIALIKSERIYVSEKKHFKKQTLPPVGCVQH